MDLAGYQPSADAAVPGAERRRFPRHTAQVQIEVQQEGSDVPLRMETSDLSRGGCYVQLMMPFPIGTYVNVKLWIDGTAIRVRGRVVTRHPQFGNGMMFLEFQGDGEQLLGSYLDAIVE
ncbi:MAG: PilZ domain-containing protein [Terriglobales bacterium]